MLKRNTHLLKLWMKHFMTQMESEFTPKILKADVPTYEMLNHERFDNYVKLFKIYSVMDFGQMITNYNVHVKKLLTTVIPYSKAKFLLSRLFIYESQTNDLLLDHSFVKDTSRNIDFLKSKNFQLLLKKFNRSIKQSPLPRAEIMLNQRRRSVVSNFNNRTYNKDTLQELSFGQFVLKISTIKTPLDQEYKIGLIFEKNLKRKQKLDKKTFIKFSKKLNRRLEEQKNRNDKYIQVLDFFRFLFDFKRSYPFS